MNQLIKLTPLQGGIHPPENKDQSNQLPIAQGPIPPELILPISMHTGAPAEPLVSVGDQVLKGQKIAEGQGFITANIHAPTSGKVVAIETRTIAHPSGMDDTCIIIEPDGLEKWCELHPLPNYKLASHQVLIDQIKEAGIVGLGGAAFPTSVKVSPGHKKIDTIILNGAECEPYITADDVTMRERAEQVLFGADVLMKIHGDDCHCLIAIEDNKPEAIEAMNLAIEANEEFKLNTQVVTIPTKYPSGGEKQLIQILTGKEVPVEKRPADLGLLCQNIGTAVAIYRAVALGQPLISRVTTVTGGAVGVQRNYEVLLGTPVGTLLQDAGYNPTKMDRLIMGGPMMGFNLKELTVPVVKSTNCLLAPEPNELSNLNQSDISQACIRCGMCVEVCPAGLLPQQLYWFTKAKEFHKAAAHNLMDCIECGACAFVCPSQIPLVQYYRHGKAEIRNAIADKEKSDRAKQRFEFRQHRIEQEKLAKEAKRKARAEAAAKAQAEKKASEQSSGSNQASSTPSVPVLDLAKIEKQLAAAKKARDNAQQKAEHAESDDIKQKFLTAVEKSEARIKQLEMDLAQAHAAKSSGQDKEEADPNSPERLQKKLELAESRLKTAEQRVKDAEASNSEQLPLLKTGYEKQLARVNGIRKDLEDALKNSKASASNSSTSDKDSGQSSKSEIEAAERKVKLAEDRLNKAKERLNMAIEQKLDTVEPLQKALEKMQTKLEQAQSHLNDLKGAEKSPDASQETSQNKKSEEVTS